MRVREFAGGIEFEIHVRPRASREGVGGVHAGALEVRVTAAPVDGKANAAVLRALASALGVRPPAVSLLSGSKGRRKRVRVEGSGETLCARFARLASQGDPD